MALNAIFQIENAVIVMAALLAFNRRTLTVRVRVAHIDAFGVHSAVMEFFQIPVYGNIHKMTFMQFAEFKKTNSFSKKTVCGLQKFEFGKIVEQRHFDVLLIDARQVPVKYFVSFSSRYSLLAVFVLVIYFLR